MHASVVSSGSSGMQICSGEAHHVALTWGQRKSIWWTVSDSILHSWNIGEICFNLLCSSLCTGNAPLPALHRKVTTLGSTFKDQISDQKGCGSATSCNACSCMVL
jgi:hypothetical protein